MNISGKYLKVWEVKEQNGLRKVNLGDSIKDKDGNYENFTWFDCLLVGNAKNVQVSQGDTVEVKNGLISKRKYNGKYYDNVVIFDLEVMRQNNGQNATTGQQGAPQRSQAQVVEDIFGDGPIPF